VFNGFLSSFRIRLDRIVDCGVRQLNLNITATELNPLTPARMPIKPLNSSAPFLPSAKLSINFIKISLISSKILSEFQSLPLPLVVDAASKLVPRLGSVLSRKQHKNTHESIKWAEQLTMLLKINVQANTKSSKSECGAEINQSRAFFRANNNFFLHSVAVNISCAVCVCACNWMNKFAAETTFTATEKRAHFSSPPQ